MKILVTGSAGFIGSHLSKKLIKQGHEVIGLDNINDYYDVTIKKDRLKSIGNKNFTFYKINLEDELEMDKIFENEKPQVVINLAAQAGVRYSLENPRAYIDSNIVGFTNILECSRHHKVEHLIYASSSSVYGANTSKPFSTSDNIDHPLSLYAATKKSNELMAHTYSHLYNLPTTGLRFFTVYGPWGRPDMALFKFTKAIVNDEEIDVYNHGNMMRDFTYVDDIVEAISRLVKKPAQPNPEWSGANPDPSSSYAPYKIYNIGNNSPVRLMEFVEAIENKLGKKAKKNYMDLQPGDVPETYANVDDLFKNIDFKPETTIQDGVNQFVDWYIDYYSIEKREI
ncbi:MULTISPECIES: NAD-dependent epimerase [Staphylococcaceae]|uniref:NAD-dependent epimerase n=1 Tax=Staphylococcaceae TaxID=90964 RepID=UPI001950DC28|nr:MULTISPECIES: NAD-dependent epimerase [Staphylococcaceae]MCE4950834.1 NAD-dependent epimerase [Staphylococcus hominis]MCE4953104.1 NAD-dependent epimerase [Staphylococcus hominis]MEB8131387.1 NAD-dependent epimerase [Mammaliicoccus sciuri]